MAESYDLDPNDPANQTDGELLAEMLRRSREAAGQTAGATAPADEPGAAAAPGLSKSVGQYLNENAFGPSSAVRDVDNAAEQTPKRLIGRVVSHFDPTKGITPEMLQELNALDIGDFSLEAGGGKNDKLRIANKRNNAGWHHEAGGTGVHDINAGLDPEAGTSKGWYWGDDELNPAFGAGGGGAPGAGPVTRTAGSAVQGIAGLMPTDDDFYQRLQAQLAEIVGGPAALDREALLRRFGA